MRQGWHPQDILAAVRKKGSSLQRLALTNGFERTTLHKSLHQRFPHAHQVIADFLGVPRHELWPDWYRPGGAETPKSRRSRRRTAR